jgi:hypothetical protein
MTKLETIELELRTEVSRLLRAKAEISDEEGEAIVRINTLAKMLYGYTYDHRPEAMGTDPNWGLVR